MPIVLQPKKVKFDLDDVGWLLVRRVSERTGIPYEMLDEFHTMENERLTLEQRETVVACYKDPEIFRDIEFLRGFNELMELEKHGALVGINSNSLSHGVIDVKRPQVMAQLPTMPEERMFFGLVNEHTTIRKDFGDDVYIVVDDSPYNIAKSTAEHCIMPRRPWNQTAKAKQMVAHKQVYYVDCEEDMYGIYDKVIALLRL